MNRISKGIMYIVSILNLIGVCFVYPDLPEQIPIRWDVNWNISDWADKYVIFILGAIPILLLILFSLLPKIDPKGKNYEKHKKAYFIMIMVIELFLIIMVWITIAASLNIKMNMKLILPSLFGILFIILGNYLPIIKSNYFFGIRNPWTLSNETVWRKTHRIGGYVFAIMGVIMFILAILNRNGGKISFVVLIIGILAINIYSFLIYRKESLNKMN